MNCRTFAAAAMAMVALLTVTFGCTTTRPVTSNASYSGDYVKGGIYVLLADLLLVDRKHRGWGPASAWSPELRYDAMPDDSRFFIWTQRDPEEIRLDRSRQPRDRSFVDGVLTKGTRVQFVELLLHQHPGTIDTIPVARVLDGEWAGILVALQKISRKERSKHPRYFVDDRYLERAQ